MDLYYIIVELVPNVVILAEDFAVSDEASAVLVEELLALAALEAGSVPLEVGGHPEDVLIVDLASAANAQTLIQRCRVRRRCSRCKV
jgi:hypothetical protein